MEMMEKKPFKSKRSIKEHDSLYKEKFEILNEKYEKIKDILKQVLKDLNEEKEKQQLLITEYQNVVLEVKEKETLLERMQSVSEAVIDEYSALRVKCDLEVEAATNASKRATKYFQENQKLKRSSQNEILDSHVSDSNELSRQESNVEESTSELDLLNNLASELRTEIASLKVQLTKEIEKQNSLKEDFEIAKDLYEQEVKEHKITREKLLSLELENDVHKMASHGPENLKSSVAQCTVNNKEEQKNISIESESSETLDDSQIFDEKLKLAEGQIENFKHQNKALNTRIQELEFQNRKLRAEASASTNLPIPPPPPPPPLPPASFNPIKSLITFIHAGKKSAKIKKESTETQHQKAMSEMMDVIKKGRVQLKPTPKPLPQSVEKQESALGEMKSILSTLKKKDTICKEEIKDNPSQAFENTKYFDKYPKQACESFSISADVDDELKLLLRKRSLKSIPNENLCAIPLDDMSDTSNDIFDRWKPECSISTLNDSMITSENNNGYPIQSKEECLVSPEADSNEIQNSPEADSNEIQNSPEVDSNENQNSPAVDNTENQNSPQADSNENLNSPDSASNENQNSPDSGSNENQNSPKPGNSENQNSPKPGSSANQNSSKPGSSENQNSPEPVSNENRNSPEPVSNENQNSPEPDCSGNQYSPDPDNSEKQSLHSIQVSENTMSEYFEVKL